MKKKIMAMLTSAMCLATAALNSVNVVSAADEKTNVSFLMGDVNEDGSFGISDVVLLQKWLLGVPDTHLANWKAADFCEDNRLDVFDLTLMKRALIEKLNGSPELDDPEVREILFGYPDSSSGASAPMSSIRLAMKCKAFCPDDKKLTLDVAMLGLYEPEGYDENTFLYNYSICPYTYEDSKPIEDKRLIINDKSGNYIKEYVGEDREVFNVGREYNNIDTYHHETASLNFENYSSGSSGKITFIFKAVFLNDDGTLPEQPQSEGYGQTLYYYVGDDGVGISNVSIEDAEESYKNKGSNEVPPLADPETDNTIIQDISFGKSGSDGQGSPMSSIRIAMNCKAFSPANESLALDVAMLGLDEPQGYKENTFLYNYSITPYTYEDMNRIEDSRLIINGESGNYVKEYVGEDREVFNVGREYDDYETYHHETTTLDFHNYPVGTSGSIMFIFKAVFLNEDGSLPEHPSSEGNGQTLFFYVGTDGVGISNISVEDAEKNYNSKGSGDITPSDTYTGRWHGKNISFDLYEALKNPESETIPVAVTFKDTGASEFVYLGKTIQEYTNDLVCNEEIAKMEELLEQGDYLKHGENIYITGTPDGIVWTHSYYDYKVEFYGDELLSKYIVEGEFLKEQLQSDLKELKALYQSALDEAVDAFYISQIEDTITILNEKGIRCERIEDTHDMVMYITSDEFDLLNIETASYFGIAFQRQSLL